MKILGYYSTGKRNISKKRLTAVIVLAAFVVCLLVWTCSAVEDMTGLFGSKEETVLVSIPEGAGVRDIAKILDDEGLIRHRLLFRVFEKLGASHVFQQGGHMIDKGLGYAGIIKKLTSSPEIGVRETVTVLIPEGYEARHIAAAFAEKGLADEKEFLRLLDEGDFDYSFVKSIDRKENRLEGYLFPATYEVFVGESEYDIICRMLSAFESKIVPLYEKSGTKYTLDEIVTMASLVEREAANDTERGKVASVFYNRIARDMTLSSCATVQYIIKERKDILSNSDIRIKSDYNTYINKGLPPGPIASPGEASVMAALYPEDTEYLYFAARADGSENVFTRTGEEHLQTVEMLQR